jgi:hypothetical protein
VAGVIPDEAQNLFERVEKLRHWCRHAMLQERGRKQPFVGGKPDSLRWDEDIAANRTFTFDVQ